MPVIDLSSTDIGSLPAGGLQVEFYDASFAAPGSFGVRVNRGGRRSFFLILQVGGRRRRVTLGHFPTLSVEQARIIAAEFIHQASIGKDPVASIMNLGRPIFFKDLVEKYRSEELPTVPAPSTRREYSRVLARELLPVFGNYRVSAIGASDVRRLIDMVSVERGSPVMARRTAALFRRIFNFGVEKGYLEYSPFDHLTTAEEEPDNQIPQTPRFLPPGDIKLLWEATRAEKPLISAIFRLMILTGLRPGELLAMRWEEIDGEEWRNPRRKSDSTETLSVFLPAPTQVILREIPGYGVAVGAVFALRGGAPVQHIRKAAERIRIRAGLKERLSPIDLRRTTEYGMRSIGIRPDIVDRALGRKGITRRGSGVYLGYDYTAEVRNAYRAWSGYVWKLVNGLPLPPDRRPPPDKLSGEQPVKKESGKVIQLFR